MPQSLTLTPTDYVRRHFTESSKIITWNVTITDPNTDGLSPSAFYREFKNNYLKCHDHRRQYRVSGSILPTQLPTDCANSKGLCIKCISDRVILPTDLPTDHEKYEGSLKILVRNSKIIDGFLTIHRRNKLK